MKKLLVGVAAALVSAGAASAADMPVKAPIPVPPVYTWTGFYVGLDSGWAWGTSSGTLTTAALTPAVPYSFSINGPIFGPFGGYQHQFSMVVVGVEADAQFGANLKGSSGPAALIPPFASPPFYNVTTSVASYGSVRGKLGLAFDRFMIYGTGGWARGTFTTKYAFATTPAVPFSAITDVNSNGWTAGGGVDYLYWDNVFLFLEYRFTTLNAVGFVDVPNNAGDLGNKVKINDVRGGLGVKF